MSKQSTGKFCIDKLLVEAGVFSKDSCESESLDKFATLFHKKLQRMSLEEFKQSIQHKLILEKKTQTVVVEMSFSFLASRQ